MKIYLEMLEMSSHESESQASVSKIFKEMKKFNQEKRRLGCHRVSDPIIGGQSMGFWRKDRKILKKTL